MYLSEKILEHLEQLEGPATGVGFEGPATTGWITEGPEGPEGPATTGWITEGLEGLSLEGSGSIGLLKGWVGGVILIFLEGSGSTSQRLLKGWVGWITEGLVGGSILIFLEGGASSSIGLLRCLDTLCLTRLFFLEQVKGH